MSRIVVAPVIIPLIGAALALLVRSHRNAQRAVSLIAMAAATAASGALVAHAATDGAAVANLGGWAPAIGITYVADRLAAAMLLISTLTMSIVLLYAIGQRLRDEASPFYHPAYLVLAAGVSMAFLTGDLFHLFVSFELLLMSSYVLMMLNGTEGQIRSGTTYVILNTVESSILVLAIGWVYAATGTLNMAELPEALAQLDDAPRTVLQLLLLVAFGMKAAVFPLFFWLPDSYPTAPSPVAALFAGLLTKIGVYAIIRTQTLLFDDAHRTLLLWVAGLTMVIGVLGAIAQSDIKRILSFHIISQIGYMIGGIAIGGPAAIAATVFFVVHQIPIKTSLFLIEGLISRLCGTGSLAQLSGLARRSSFLAGAFLLSALSLAGLPPFSGFVGKLGLVVAGIDADAMAFVAVALGGSLLTLISMTKIWLGAFWGDPAESTAPVASSASLRQVPLMTVATASLVAVGVAIAVFSGPIYDYMDDIGTDTSSPALYREAVMGP